MHNPSALRRLLQATARCALLVLGLVVGLSVSLGVAGQPIGPTRTWMEQIQLHDGSKITAKRTYVLGGRSEPGARESSSTFQTIVFNTPSGDIEWTTDFRDSQPEPNSLSLIAFDIVRGVPHIATRPAGCIAYNKWQRPNPPQVLFKYVNKQWERVALPDFPKEITKANVVLGRPSTEVLKAFYSVEDVQRENQDVRHPEYRSVLREAVNYDPSCIPMVTNGKGLWRAQAWFSKKPSLEACLAGCKSENFDAATCPCNQFFKGE
jgi:hypothetical protein